MRENESRPCQTRRPDKRGLEDQKGLCPVVLMLSNAGILVAPARLYLLVGIAEGSPAISYEPEARPFDTPVRSERTPHEQTTPVSTWTCSRLNALVLSYYEQRNTKTKTKSADRR